MIQILNSYYMGCTDKSYVLYKGNTAIGYYSSVKGLVEGMIRDYTLYKIKTGRIEKFWRGHKVSRRITKRGYGKCVKVDVRRNVFEN